MEIDNWDITKKAEYLIEVSKNLKDNPSPEKSGGYLTLGLSGLSKVITLGVGKTPLEKIPKYIRISSEKTYRVFSHWLREPYQKNPIEVVSSWQTRNPDEIKWGGAILFTKDSRDISVLPNICAFSGGSEYTDESISYTIGNDLGWVMENDLLKKIKDISNNPLIDEMIFEFNKKFPKN